MLEHRLLAKKVAWLTAKNLPMEIEDAISAAHVGLVQAAKSFDFTQYPTRKKALSTFKHFAWMRMHGAIIDESRRNSLVRRTDARNGERAITVSLDEVWENSGTPKIEIEGTHGDLDNLIDFCDAIASLKPRERLVVNAIGEGVTQREIAEKLGITESRVSQIASAARAKLKEKMAA